MAKHGGIIVSQTQHQCDFGREVYDSQGMLAGFVISKLGDRRQTLQDLRLRFLQLAGAKSNALFEKAVLLDELEMQTARMQQVAGPELHLLGVQRLCQEIHSA